MKIAMISFSKDGYALMKKLEEKLKSVGYDVEGSVKCKSVPVSLEESLTDWTRAHFNDSDGLIFIGACGIAVRAIAPFVASKTSDPAVLCMDDKGGFCISLLSGHLGGANALCRTVAGYVGATPVITTSTDNHGAWAVDLFAKENSLAIKDMKKAKEISAKILAGDDISIVVEEGRTGKGDNPYLRRESECAFADVYVGIKTPNGAREALQLVPKAVYAGIGCKRGTKKEQINSAFSKALSLVSIDPDSVIGVATIDLKADEEGLIDFCKEHAFSLKTFSAEKLKQVPGEFTASEFVKGKTGVDNVCERAVMCLSDELILKKQAKSGVTIALGKIDWSVDFE